MLIKHIRNYLGNSFSSKLIIFLSALIYSRFMSVEEFGILNLYMSYLWIFVIIFTSNLYTVVGRYAYEEKNDFNYFFTTNMIFILCIFLLCTIILISNIDYFESFLRLEKNILYILIITALALVLESIFTQISIYSKKSGTLFKLTFFKSISAFILSLIFLLFVVGSNKYLGVIYAELFVSIILIIYILLNLKKYFHFKYDKEHLKYMINYAIPLIPYMLSLTLLSQSDRIMIDYFYSSTETGLYSMVYNLGIVLVIIVTALMNAWNPSYFKYMNNKEYKEVENGSESIYLISFFITLLIVLFGENIALILLTKEYENSLHLIAIIAIGGLASSIWQIWARITVYIKKTYITSLFAVIATILNVSLNYFLLPLYGYEIAAWTTLISYLVIGLLCLIFTNYYVNYYKIQIINKIDKIVFLLIIYYIFYYLKIDIFLESILKVSIFILFLFVYKNKILSIRRLIFNAK